MGPKDDDEAESRRLLTNWMLIMSSTFAVAWLVLAVFSDRLFIRIAAVLFSALALVAVFLWRRTKGYGA
ncbi:hypothetical protein [Cellulomonas carbonis]|uniref:Uncharacterized protein n=1 Tax=Cellulomonas carbonis T26 TaxID=947969 RepID=A0A0A0BVE8_9CELL|nr:hypothetical protein [Cellulomonas carbonis]KGM11896.1 hypothetical protein N868_04990 [Cellulomonas carbonis T26]GGB91407.1 hypothetical protein GCM10010972_00040 [Cellulomonas carbonis]